MRKFKLGHSDKEELSEKEIAKYKDFGKVVTNYEQARDALHKKPLYKQPKTFIILLLIVLVAILVSELTDEKDPTENPDQIENLDNLEQN